MKRAKILIIGAMETELRDLLTYFRCKSISKVKDYYPMWSAENTIGFDLNVLQTYVGDTNAAISTSLALQSLSPDYVFKIGCVGGNSQGIHTGDLLSPLGLFHSGSWITRSRQDNNPTSDASKWKSVFGELPYQVNNENLGSHPYFIDVNQTLSDKFIGYFNKRENPPISSYVGGGNMWFFDKAFMENVAITHIPGNNPNQVWAGDMESYSIAQACAVFNIPFFGFYKVSNSDFYGEPYIPEKVAKLFDLKFIEDVDKFLNSL